MLLAFAGMMATGMAHNGHESGSTPDSLPTRGLPKAIANNNPKRFIRTPEQARTLESLQRLDARGELYVMDYTADYCLDELLAQGVKSNDELIGFAYAKLLNMPMPKAKMDARTGCSSFLVKSKNGHYLFCRNFDYKFSSPVNVVVRTANTIGTFCMNMMDGKVKSGSPDDGNSDNSACVAAPLGMVDGMNTHGVAISVLTVPSYGAQQHVDGKGNVTTTVVVREVLDKARSVDDALQIFDSHNFFAHGGDWKSNYHFFIADATGRAVVVEYVNEAGRDDKDVAEYSQRVTEIDYVTNNYMYPAWREPLRDTLRESKIAQAIGTTDSLAGAFRLLMSVHRMHDPQQQDKTLLWGDAVGPDAFPGTLWSVVYDLTAGKTYIATGRELEEGKDPFEMTFRGN